MTLPAFRPGLFSIFAIAAVVALLALFSSNDSALAIPYDTSGEVLFCNRLPSGFPTSVPGSVPELQGGDPYCNIKDAPTGSSPDLTSTFSVPGGNSNFGSSVISLFPDDWTVNPVPVGTVAGGLISSTTLGLLNGPCTTPLTVEFVLYSASTDTANTTSPLPEGQPNRFSQWDGVPLQTDPALNDQFAASNATPIVKYPDFYNEIFDPDLDYPGGPNGPLPPVAPKARYTGLTLVFGDWIILSFFYFDARDLEPFAKDADNFLSQFGFVGATDYGLSLSILQDPTVTAISPSPISDFCAPLGVETTLLGQPGGNSRLVLPSSAGTDELYQHSYSYRDADGDGIENQLDTCPFNANTGQDADNDGIDDACDPGPGGGPTDQDLDGYVNRQDPCPLVAGSPEQESENQNTLANAAKDGGPRADGIGDGCDPHPTTSYVDATNNEGTYTEDVNIMHVCIGPSGSDANQNGICDNEEPWTKTDSDFDGWTDAVEAINGTNPNDKCADTTTANDEADDQWPPDFDDNKVINIVDVLALKPVFGTVSPRHDMDGSGGSINIVDVLALKPVFNKICSDRLTGAI